MRNILFRGQTRRKGERVLMDGTPIDSNWVYGGTSEVSKDTGDFSIIYQTEPEIQKYPVYTNTICQYTGLTDKNGKKIFEGDIVFVTDVIGYSGQVDTGIGEIIFLEGLWYIDGRVQNGLYDIDRCFQIEVIGNVFDNTELIKESD